jgi:rhodanese-related sulfurtransferase
MRKIFLTIMMMLGLMAEIQAQTTDPAYKKKLSHLYHHSVPLMEPTQLEEALEQGEDIVLLDTRTEREYEVSHLPGARFVEFNKFNQEDFEGLDRATKVVVYCTVGYRSERIGEKLQKMGFSDVYNLYGGIFEWKNQGHEVINPEGKETEQVHTYNKDWSKWLNSGEKVYK